MKICRRPFASVARTCTSKFSFLGSTRPVSVAMRPGDMLVFNDTKVIPARLTGERRRPSADGSGVARIEATLIRREGPETWAALARPGRRLRPGDRIDFGGLTAEVATRGEAEVRLRIEKPRDFAVIMDVTTRVKPDKEFCAEIEKICGPESLEVLAN